jgi:hypothetical protein
MEMKRNLKNAERTAERIVQRISRTASFWLLRNRSQPESAEGSSQWQRNSAFFRICKGGSQNRMRSPGLFKVSRKEFQKFT